MLQRIALTVLLLLSLFATVKAEEQNTDAFKAVIQRQLESMARDDGAGAYSEAAPLIHMMFPTPDDFMTMVKRGYFPVYRNKGYVFQGGGKDDNGRNYQNVLINGTDGNQYVARYFMEQQADGTWKISGCTLLKAGETA